MKAEIIPIVESYLESRKLNKGISDSFYKEKLRSIHIDEDKINDLILLMDDSWTEDQMLRLKLKNAKFRMIGGYLIAFSGLVLLFYQCSG